MLRCLLVFADLALPHLVRQNFVFVEIVQVLVSSRAQCAADQRRRMDTGTKGLLGVSLTSTPASPIFWLLCPNLLADWAAMMAAAMSLSSYLLYLDTPRDFWPFIPTVN